MNDEPVPTWGMPEEPIPNVSGTSIDLSAIAKEAAPRAFLSLADANAQFGFVHCIKCGRGGHTGTSLITIIADVTTNREAKACAEHATTYLRPKDLMKHKRHK